jgi:hypothetical protein
MASHEARLDLSGLSGKAAILVFLVLLLPLGLSCKHRKAPPPPPQPPVPSAVLTEGGVVFYVWNVRLPGTSQDLQLRQAGANTWLPLVQIRQVDFSGSEQDGFRKAVITLTTGERTEGELSVKGLLEGTTDLGSWNIPLREVRQLTLVHN